MGSSKFGEYSDVCNCIGVDPCFHRGCGPFFMAPWLILTFPLAFPVYFTQGKHFPLTPLPVLINKGKAWEPIKAHNNEADL